MKVVKAIVFFCLLLVIIDLQAQNLVPNGGFEDYYSCPSNYSQVDSCIFWINPTLSTPDYFNQCATVPTLSIPKNNYGYQTPKSGNAYCGIITYFPSEFQNYREYIEVPLKSSLIANVCYHVSFYVNLSNSSKKSSKNIGAYFSDSIIKDINCYCPLPFTPQFSNQSSNLPDTLSWTLIEGDFIAGGGEKYMIIGNFSNDASTSTANVNSNGWLSHVYLYIDEVSVYACNTPVYSANAGANQDICNGKTTSLEMLHQEDYKYRWFTIDSSLIDTTNIITVTPPTTTKYVLWIKNLIYEESWDTVTVNVMNDCPQEIEIPNVFTPNGDGYNDEFKIKGESIKEINLIVYNRYGKQVVEINDPLKGWDGTKNNGQKSDEGVYYFVAVITMQSGEKVNKNGTVTLLR